MRRAFSDNRSEVSCSILSVSASFRYDQEAWLFMSLLAELDSLDVRSPGPYSPAVSRYAAQITSLPGHG